MKKTLDWHVANIRSIQSELAIKNAMEKLTIQHLAAYLPYGLKVIDTRNETVKRVSFDIVHGDDILNVGTLLNVNSHFTGKGPYSPILHPLSDLTKPIKHKGETFVPIERLKSDFLGNEYQLTFYQKGCYLYAYRDGCHVVIPQGDMIQKLFEWRIDVFDLIGKGLAVDLNSLDFNPHGK